LTATICFQEPLMSFKVLSRAYIIDIPKSI
jgi:hypothetical protein